MKLWFYALGMCQSMFCALPFPWHGWEEKARDRMLLCLPLIGLEIGLIWRGLVWVCDWLALPQAIRAVVMCAAPYLLTGFMHLDGLMDVTDAVRSYRSLERRREILKDSHVGSFAVIGLALVLLGQFAAAISLSPGMELGALILIPVVSRCCSVLAIQLLPPMETSASENAPTTGFAVMPENPSDPPHFSPTVSLSAETGVRLSSAARAISSFSISMPSPISSGES